MVPSGPGTQGPVKSLWSWIFDDFKLKIKIFFGRVGPGTEKKVRFYDWSQEVFEHDLEKYFTIKNYYTYI